MERAILGGGRSFQFNGRTLRGSAYRLHRHRLHRRTCYTKKEPPRRISEVLKVAATYSPTTQCSTIGDAVSLPCALSAARAPLRSAVSRLCPLRCSPLSLPRATGAHTAARPAPHR